MADSLERFFNWQSDMDWAWGPFLPLRPPRNVRLTLMFWLKLFGIISLFIVPLAEVLGTILAYYNYTSAQRHEVRITPVVVTEHWVNSTAPGILLFPCFWIMLFSFLSLFASHWAWNRRADRLNRELSPMLAAISIVSGVWPPPPMHTEDDQTKS